MDHRDIDHRDIDISVLMLGIDAVARETVQQAMREIAERGRTDTPAGLVRMLRQAVAVLRGADEAWTHAGAQNHLPMPAGEAEPKFALATHTARSRFERELIRNADGTIERRDAPALPPREDARGVVVVTVVVAARVELADLANVRDRDALERALDGLSAVDPRDLVAMEVIWSPADAREVVTAEEIEERYPELSRLEPRS